MVFSVVDLFCGGGGSGVGWNAQKGFRVCAAVDSCTQMVGLYRKNVLPTAIVADAAHEQHRIVEYCQSAASSKVDVLFMNPPTSVPLSLCIDYVKLLSPRVFFIVAAAKSFSGKWGHRTASAPCGYDVTSFYLHHSSVGSPVDSPIGVLMGARTCVAVSAKDAEWLMGQVESVFRRTSGLRKSVTSVGAALGFHGHYYMPPRGDKHISGVFDTSSECRSVRWGAPPASYVARPGDSAPVSACFSLTSAHARTLKGLPAWFHLDGSLTFQTKVVQGAVPPLLCEVLAMVAKKVFSFSDFAASDPSAGPARVTGILISSGLSFNWADDGVSPDILGEVTVSKTPLVRISVPEDDNCSWDFPVTATVSSAGSGSVGVFSEFSWSSSVTTQARQRMVGLPGGRVDALLTGASQNMRDHFGVLKKGSERSVRYTTGSNKRCDSRLEQVLGFALPSGWDVELKRARSGRETFQARSPLGVVFRSLGKARMHAFAL